MHKRPAEASLLQSMATLEKADQAMALCAERRANLDERFEETVQKLTTAKIAIAATRRAIQAPR